MTKFEMVRVKAEVLELVNESVRSMKGWYCDYDEDGKQVPPEDEINAYRLQVLIDVERMLEKML